VYRDTAHVIPTSILVERLFSKAKHILTYDRKRMEHRRLEEVPYSVQPIAVDERTVQDALTRVEREEGAATSATSATSATTTTSASVAPIHEIDHDDDL